MKTSKAYIRVSTLEQAREDRASIDTQKDRISSFARSQGLELSEQDFYIDTSSGATFVDRPSLERLRQDIRRGRVKHLFVWKQDRLSRTARDTLELLQEFKNYGVTYKSVTEPFDTSSKFSEAIMGIIAVFAQMERDNIAERMITGRYTKVQRDGTNFGSEPPFGYKTIEKRFVIVEEDAEIVRLIYKLYLQYKSDNRVRIELERRGISARVKLDRRQIMRILTNVKYTGRMKVKEIIYEQKHPPIIEIPMFEEVQRIRDANFKGYEASWSCVAPDFILRDVAKCGLCGREMVKREVPSQKKDRGRLGYYACSSCHRRNKKRDCEHRKFHKKEKLEGSVKEMIFEHIGALLNDSRYMQRHLNVTSQQEIDHIKAQIENKQKTLKSKDLAKKKWLQVFEKQDSPPDEFLERYEAIRKEIKELEGDISSLKASLEVEKAKKEDFKQKERFYREFDQNWEEASLQEKRDMINALIKIIRVFPKGNVEIDYNF